MKDINNIKPKSYICFEKGNEKLFLSVDDKVKIITDGTEYDKEYNGEITFLNEDGIEINNEGVMFWEYIKEIISE